MQFFASESLGIYNLIFQNFFGGGVAPSPPVLAHMHLSRELGKTDEASPSIL